ncbi:MAG: YhcH/YjgK/YiaL family protein [Bacteroidia bacterium]|nr:YhcH/YjgK/YiaL family protein [Bacteroidia bacterium]
MKKKLLLSALLVVFSGIFLNLLAQSGSAQKWTAHKAKKWFNKKEWLNGAAIQPNEAIDKTEFARQYHANKEYWDKVFTFIKEHDLKMLAPGRYPIDGTNVFATITEDPSKDYEKTQWESHRKYIDLQYVVTGEEKMGKYPFTQLTVTNPYDDARDIAHYSGEGKVYTVPAGTFMIFFPSDAHRPNITPGGNKVIKKVVIKVLAAK